jgi:hypothetical protein
MLARSLDREIERWERLGVSGHEQGQPGWIAYAEGAATAALAAGGCPLARSHCDEFPERQPASAAGELLSAERAAPRHPDRGRRILIRSTCGRLAARLSWRGSCDRSDRAGATRRRGSAANRRHRAMHRATGFTSGADPVARRAISHRTAVRSGAHQRRGASRRRAGRL